MFTKNGDLLLKEPLRLLDIRSVSSTAVLAFLTYELQKVGEGRGELAVDSVSSR